MTDRRSHTPTPAERVVVTGIGAVTPCGLDMPSTWAAVLEGRSGIGPIESFDASGLKARIAGEVRDFDADELLGSRVARRADRSVQFALVAADEAIERSGLQPSGLGDRAGVFIASGAGGIHTYLEQHRRLDTRGPGALSPLLIPMIVVDSASVQVATRLGATGPSLGIASACASSVDALGLALETIRRGDADVMIAGGAEAAVNILGVGGFDRMGALSRHNEAPHAASRPFDKERSGFVLSEGAVVLVLESLTHARARGGPIIAELEAYASTSDAAHTAAPDTLARGAARCLGRAMEKAHRGAAQVDFVCAHATGTPLGDPIEALAIRHAFGDSTEDLHITAPKGVTGHLLGAAGALSVGLACLSLESGLLPPTLNLGCPDDGQGLVHVCGEAAEVPVRAGLIPAFGFGGHNSAILAAHVNPADPAG